MIYYQVNMQDLTRIEQALGMMKDKSAIVLRSAINSAAKDIEKQMIKGAKKRYVLKEGAAGFKAAHKPIRKATTRSFSLTTSAMPANPVRLSRLQKASSQE